MHQLWNELRLAQESVSEAESQKLELLELQAGSQKLALLELQHGLETCHDNLSTIEAQLNELEFKMHGSQTQVKPAHLKQETHDNLQQRYAVLQQAHANLQQEYVSLQWRSSEMKENNDQIQRLLKEQKDIPRELERRCDHLEIERTNVETHASTGQGLFFAERNHNVARDRAFGAQGVGEQEKHMKTTELTLPQRSTQNAGYAVDQAEVVFADHLYQVLLYFFSRFTLFVCGGLQTKLIFLVLLDGRASTRK